MDRGAARSRKRAEQLEKAARRAKEESGRGGRERDPSSAAGPSRPRPQGKDRTADAEDDQGQKGAKHLKHQKVKKTAEPQSRDPELYKPKAIRSSAALIWSQTPFETPPPKERLEGITRVDLASSAMTDINWLAGSSVRWLSLNGCPIKDWTPVGTLKNLTVLNINICELQDLPECFKELSNLKAIVAMHNPWKSISADVLGSMPELNSLIISHSPNLASLPSLASLVHLSKLTFSHCPRLTASSLPDLSSLPLLRDVKMNNLPLLVSLPPHLRTWGTGPMSQVKETDERNGAGLEVLDLGSCSLPASTLDQFTKKEWSNLRSLTLYHNPLSTEDPSYASKLQEYTRALPKLQIIDTIRVVERKRKGEPGETKKQRLKREKKSRPSGTNNIRNSKVRQWGTAAAAASEDEDSGIDDDDAVDFVDEDRKRLKAMDKERKGAPTSKPDVGTTNGDKKRKRDADKAEEKSKKVKPTISKPSLHKPKPIPHPDSKVSKPGPSSTPARATMPKPPAPAADTLDATRRADPSALAPAGKKKPSKTETSVVGVIDVAAGQSDKAEGGKKGHKGKKDKRAKSDHAAPQATSTPSATSKGGIDLKAMFGKSEESSSGLGVGGW